MGWDNGAVLQSMRGRARTPPYKHKCSSRIARAMAAAAAVIFSGSAAFCGDEDASSWAPVRVADTVRGSAVPDVAEAGAVGVAVPCFRSGGSFGAP
ncbi:hypothetical protein CYMTET_14437 [Cymbomonas tetramitiformis]|uniref:Uncharacterized protein n=1 Tax=Cymbomonas tetramitiformis TaxID=36881 RepID=A0AAE0LAD2_9CHLO|nr:hypothetical protein CYMTET_14437 [Cymbomonas tetramitiformis]